MYNRYRLISSGLLLLFALYCLIWEPELPFSFPKWVYVLATLYFAAFPIRDMLPLGRHALYKGRQYASGFQPDKEYEKTELRRIKKSQDRRAIGAMLFWLAFLATVGILYRLEIIGSAWIFFFFAFSNFSVYFAVFFWCPFYAIFIRPECCMECRIYNWDSFFSYSFLIFLPYPGTILLFLLGVLSLLQWEGMHALHPERFYKLSNGCLTCEQCDHEACKQGKKKFFSTKLKEDYK